MDLNRIVIGAWITDDELQEFCNDLNIPYDEALDIVSNPELQSEVSEMIVEIVWDALTGKEDDDG